MGLSPRGTALSSREGPNRTRGSATCLRSPALRVCDTSPARAGRTEASCNTRPRSDAFPLSFRDTVPANSNAVPSNSLTIPSNSNSVPANCGTAPAYCDTPLPRGAAQFAVLLRPLEGTVRQLAGTALEFAGTVRKSERGASQSAGTGSPNGRGLCHEEWARPRTSFVLSRASGTVTAPRSGQAPFLGALSSTSFVPDPHRRGQAQPRRGGRNEHTVPAPIRWAPSQSGW
jgi:hypothetical protein